MGHKHVPMRMCVACRQSFPKRELVRVVRLSAGGVTLDPSGKQAGRGAYVCRKSACWKGALAKRSVEHALKVNLGDEEWARLVAFADSLEKSQDVSGDAAPAQ